MPFQLATAAPPCPLTRGLQAWASGSASACCMAGRPGSLQVVRAYKLLLAGAGGEGTAAQGAPWGNGTLSLQGAGSGEEARGGEGKGGAGEVASC